MWHKKGAMAPYKTRRPPPPLDRKRLEEMAVRYVGRYATSKAKLKSYLARKIRERGWEATSEPDLDSLAQRFAELGYVDDAAFALANAQSLTSRGFGRRRIDERLRQAGIGEEDGAGAREHAERESVDAAIRFAKRRRIGPFAVTIPDPKQREKALSAMTRAGHSFALARVITGLAPGSKVDHDELRDRAGIHC